MLEAGYQSIQSIQLQLWRKSINQSTCAEQNGVEYCMASTIPGFRHDKFHSPLNKKMKTNVVIEEMLSLIYASKTLSLLACFLTDCCLKPISYLFIYLLMLWGYYIGHIFFLFWVRNHTQKWNNKIIFKIHIFPLFLINYFEKNSPHFGLRFWLVGFLKIIIIKYLDKL
jgi:hypothetical protein